VNSFAASLLLLFIATCGAAFEVHAQSEEGSSVVRFNEKVEECESMGARSTNLLEGITEAFNIASSVKKKDPNSKELPRMVSRLLELNHRYRDASRVKYAMSMYGPIADRFGEYANAGPVSRVCVIGMLSCYVKFSGLIQLDQNAFDKRYGGYKGAFGCVDTNEGLMCQDDFTGGTWPTFVSDFDSEFKRFAQLDLGSIGEIKIGAPLISAPSNGYQREYNRALSRGNRSSTLSPATVLFTAAEAYYFGAFVNSMKHDGRITNINQALLTKAESALDECERYAKKYPELTDPGLFSSISGLRKTINATRGEDSWSRLFSTVKWFQELK